MQSQSSPSLYQEQAEAYMLISTQCKYASTSRDSLSHLASWVQEWLARQTREARRPDWHDGVWSWNCKSMRCICFVDFSAVWFLVECVCLVLCKRMCCTVAACSGRVCDAVAEVAEGDVWKEGAGRIRRILAVARGFQIHVEDK